MDVLNEDQTLIESPYSNKKFKKCNILKGYNGAQTDGLAHWRTGHNTLIVSEAASERVLRKNVLKNSCSSTSQLNLC